MDMKTGDSTLDAECELERSAKLEAQLPSSVVTVMRIGSKATVIPLSQKTEDVHMDDIEKRGVHRRTVADHFWQFEDSILALSKRNQNVRDARSMLVSAIRLGKREIDDLQAGLVKALQTADVKEDRAVHMAEAVAVHEISLQQARDAHEAGMSLAERRLSEDRNGASKKNREPTTPWHCL